MNTVLTVDDERFFHAGLDKLINWEELQCIRIGEAYNGFEALELVTELRPDVIITDIRMPGMDGLQLIEKVKGIADYLPDWIILSGYDSFSYARKAMQYGVQNYLLKPVDETELIENLRRIIAKRSSALPETQYDRTERQLMLSALIGRMISPDPEPDMLNRAESLLGAMSGIRYIQVIFHKPGNGMKPETLLRNSLESICGSERSQRVCVIGDGHFGIVHAEGAAPGSVIELVSRLHFLCSRDQPGMELYISVGKMVENLAQLFDSYRSSQHAMNVNVMKNRQPFVLADDEPAAGDTLEYRSARTMMFFSDLVESIGNGDREQLEQNLEVVFDWVRRENPSQDSMRIWLNSLFIDISRIILELDGRLDDKMQGFYRESVSGEDFFIGDFFTEIRLFCNYCLEQISELKKINRSGIVKLVSEYIRTHYQEQLSLREIGEHFSVNPVYLGRLLKDSLGMPFKQYLAEIRVAEAKKLLSRTDLRVYEVAASVGYQDCDYFSRQFSRIIGQSPGSYKRSH